MDSLKASISQLEVAKDVCRTMLRYGCTDGSALTVMQQILQVLIYLNNINDNYELVKKAKKL